MDFITSSILGGILFDSLKFGVIKFGGIVRKEVKKFSFTEEELLILEDIIESNTLNNESTIDEINSALQSSKEIQKLIEKKNSLITQKNKVKTNNGAIVGNNPGKIKIVIKK